VERRGLRQRLTGGGGRARLHRSGDRSGRVRRRGLRPAGLRTALARLRDRHPGGRALLPHRWGRRGLSRGEPRRRRGPAAPARGAVLAWRAGPCGQFVCNQIWRAATNDPIVTSSPTVVNGTVYIGGSNNIAPEDTAGRLYVYALPG